MRIGIVQTNTGRDPLKNISELTTLLKSVEGADVIITPECTNIMGYKPGVDQLVSAEDDRVVQFIRESAKASSTYFIIGSVLVLNRVGEPVNRQLVIDPSGEITAYYDKIHMFDVDLPNGESYRESERTGAGSKAIVSEIHGEKFGHSICFDLRFPALYSALSQAGAEVLIVPAAFTQSTGRAHWETLLRARAIENGAYVVAPGQTGAHQHSDASTRHCWGHSMVVSPWGEILVNLGSEPRAQVVELDLSASAKARANIPMLKAARKIDVPKVSKA